MFGFLARLLGSGLIGSFLGLFGNAINQFFQMRQQKSKNEHEKDMARIQIEILTAKTDASIRMTEAKVQGAVDLQDSKAYAESIVVGNQKSFSDKWMDKMLDQTGWLQYFSVPAGFVIMFLFACVDVLKAFMRPGLTLYLTVLTSGITYMLYMILDASSVSWLTANKAAIMLTSIVDTIVMLTTTCITWWFGDRRMAKFLMQMNQQGIVKREESERPKKKE